MVLQVKKLMQSTKNLASPVDIMLLKIHFFVLRLSLDVEMGPSFSSQYPPAVSVLRCVFFYGQILVTILP